MIQSLFLASSASGVVTAAAVIGVTGLLIGLLLGFAAKAFAVPVDEKEIAVREFLQEITVEVVVLQAVMPLRRL